MKLKLKLEDKQEDKYTIPVVKNISGRYFVEFYYNGKRFRPTFDLNRIKNIKERERQFIKARSYIEQELHKGWNPNETHEPIKTETYTFKKAVEFSFSKIDTNLRKTTSATYNSMYKHITESSYYVVLSNINVTDIKRRDIIDMFDILQHEKKITDYVYNRALKLMKQLFDKMVEYDICEYNTAEKIKYKPVDKPNITVPTNEQVFQIKEYLIKNLPNLWNFVFFLFQTGLRPNEIVNVKLKMIDLDRRIITVPKDFIKTKTNRTVPIDDYVFEWLLSKKIHVYDQECYLFGSFKTKETMNKGFTKKDIDISETPFPRQSITDVWKRLVKEGLGINVNLYSFKHLRANKELEVNNDLDRAKVLFGHSKLETTEIYANQQNELYIERLKLNTLDLNNLPSKQ